MGFGREAVGCGQTRGGCPATGLSVWTETCIIDMHSFSLSLPHSGSAGRGRSFRGQSAVPQMR